MVCVCRMSVQYVVCGGKEGWMCSAQGRACIRARVCVPCIGARCVYAPWEGSGLGKELALVEPGNRGLEWGDEDIKKLGQLYSSLASMHPTGEGTLPAQRTPHQILPSFPSLPPTGSVKASHRQYHVLLVASCLPSVLPPPLHTTAVPVAKSVCGLQPLSLPPGTDCSQASAP